MKTTLKLLICLIGTWLYTFSAVPVQAADSGIPSMESCNSKPILSCPPFVWLKPSESAHPNRTGFALAAPGGPDCGTPLITWRDEILITNACHRTYTRIWRAEDPNNPNLFDTCHQTIKQIDEEPPIFTSFPSDQVIYTDNMTPGTMNCNTATRWVEPRVFDNHLVISLDFVVERNGIEVDLRSGDAFPEGLYTITYAAFDFCGNFATVSFTIEILCADCHLQCPDDACVPLGSDISPNSLGMATAFSGNMNCGALVTEFDDLVVDNGCNGRETIIRTWTGIFDNMSPTQTTCTQTIEMKDMNAVQLFNCPTDINVVDNFTAAHWAEPIAVASDNANVITLTSNFRPGILFPVGITTIIYTAVDVCGNTASCSFKVSVLDDATFEDCPDDIEVTCGMNGVATVDWPVPEYNGTCTECRRGEFKRGFIFMGTFQGSNYYCSTGNFTYSEAVTLATRNGGHLATIDNESENDYLAQRIISPTAMIGYNDFAREGRFVWQSGSSSTYNNWFTQQPNDYNNQDVVELIKASGLWNDVDNDSKLEFILEVPCRNVVQTAGPEPGTELPPGYYTVQYEIADGCGFQRFCIFNIIVIEGVTVLCQDDIFVRVPTDVQEVAVSWDVPQVSTCCSACPNPSDCITIRQTAGPPPGSNFFRQSKTTITYEATDACGYTATCSFQVLIDIDPLSGGKITNNTDTTAEGLSADNTSKEESSSDAQASTTISVEQYVSEIEEVELEKRERNNSAQTTVYPNPAYNMLNIVIPEERLITDLQIVSAGGERIIKNVKNITDTHTINIGHLTNGLYIMVIQYQNGEQKTIRVLKM